MNEHEQYKKYIEKATFVPLVFSTHGGMGKECRTLLKRVATKIADKRGERYAHVINHLTTRLRFSLLRSVLLMLRGTRGSKHQHEGKNLDAICFSMIPN